jgi:integrase
MGKAKCYVATTEQVWALHDAMPEHLQAAVLLGAFAGLRISEACGLRVDDVDFVRGVVHPACQYGDQPLKTTGSAAPIPVPPRADTATVSCRGATPVEVAGAQVDQRR